MAEQVGSIDGARREPDMGAKRRTREGRSLDLPALTISSFKAPKISMSRHESFASVAGWFYLTSLDGRWHDSLHLHAFLPAGTSPTDAVGLALSRLQEIAARRPSESKTQKCTGNWESEHEWNIKGDDRYPCLRKARITVAVPDTQPLERNEVDAYAERRIGQIVQGFVDASRGHGDSALVAAANLSPSVEVAEMPPAQPVPRSRGRSLAIVLLCSVLLMGMMGDSFIAPREYVTATEIRSQLEALLRTFSPLADRLRFAPAPLPVPSTNDGPRAATLSPWRPINPPPPKPAVTAPRPKPKPVIPAPRSSLPTTSPLDHERRDVR